MIDQNRLRVVRAAQCFEGERFRGPTDVAIEDGRIVAVTAPTTYSEEVIVDDFGSSSTILPGLVDSHVHLTWDCSVDPLGWHRANDDAGLLAQGRRNARAALAAGLTTMRDLGGRGRVTLELRDEFAHHPDAGPTLLVSGPPITTPGGHCWFLGGDVADTPALRSEVTRQLDAGVDVIKIMATGGNITPGSAPYDSQFGLAELRATVDSAHGAGVPVAAHAHAVDGVRDVFHAGSTRSSTPASSPPTASARTRT